MKSWKKQLSEEFDRAAPPLSDEVRNAPITLTGTTHARVETIPDGNTLVKRIGIFGGGALAISLAFLFILLAVLNVFPTAPQPSFVFTLEINPAVAFVTDREGTVQSVTALNEDADVILTDDNAIAALTDIPLQEAVLRYTDTAARLGYLHIDEAGDAVRISYCDGTDSALTSRVRNGLQTYFRRSGIRAAVVENSLSAAALADRAGFHGSTALTDLGQQLKNTSARYDERCLNGTDETQIKSLYETNVVASQVKELVQNELLEHISSVHQNGTQLKNILRLNDEISRHEDNPSIFHNDYWSVKRFYGNRTFSAEFTALMEETESALEEYYQTFGIEIDSSFDLMALIGFYSVFAELLPGSTVLSMTQEAFLSSAYSLLGVLESVGCDVTALRELFTVPQSIADYVQASRASSTLLYQSRSEHYRTVYEAERAEIDEKEYDSFIDGLILRYGSLDNYWIAQKS